MVQCLSFLKKMRVGGGNILDIVLCNNDRYECWSRSERRLTRTARRNLIQFKTVKSQIEFLTTLTFQWKRTFHIQTFKCMNKHAIFVCAVTQIFEGQLSNSWENWKVHSYSGNELTKL